MRRNWAHRAFRTQAPEQPESRFTRLRKTVAVQFQKEDSNNETGALVAIDEGTVAHDARGVGRRKIDEIDVSSMSELLLRARQGGFQQRIVTQAGRAAMERQQAIMQGERIPLVYPDRLRHFART